MAKLKPAAITVDDLTEYLDGYSDFSFEVSILNTLLALGFTCEHSGSYSDPTTEKLREFDIRATMMFHKWFLRLAVECKNLRNNFPLLVSCLPRRPEEAYTDLVISSDPEKVPLEARPKFYSPIMLTRSKTIRLTNPHGLYQVGEPVGKACDQVGRATSGEITSGDSDVYAKWSQALSSAHDLTYLSTRDGEERTEDMAISLVIPLLVVPNDRLWVAEFDATGKRTTDPKPVDRCPYFVGVNYSHREFGGGSSQVISHLEFVTEKGLVAFFSELAGTKERLLKTFPFEAIRDEFNRRWNERVDR